jgi:hypothetical protein
VGRRYRVYLVKGGHSVARKSDRKSSRFRVGMMSLPGRWRWRGRSMLCVRPQRATALSTLIRQRHLTPSCGGLAPTAERTVGPAGHPIRA